MTVYTAASVPPRIRIVRSERSTGIPLLQAHITERFMLTTRLISHRKVPSLKQHAEHTPNDDFFSSPLTQ
jgi:hypothetical protein